MSNVKRFRSECRIADMTGGNRQRLLKTYCVKISVCLIAAATLLCMSAAVHAEYLTNGNFENGISGWSTDSGNPTVAQSGANAIGGSGTSLYFAGGGTQGDLYQNAGPTSSLWQLDVDFASEDPGGAGSRSFNGSIGNTFMTFRVNGDNDFQLFDSDGLSWHTPAGLEGSIIYDDDVTTTPLKHHLTIVGNWDQPSPSIDIIVTDSDNNVYKSLGLTDRWNSGSPSQGNGIGGKIIEFASHASTTGVGYVIDNFSITDVPEPTAVVLLLGGFAGLMICRRRN